MVRLSVEISDFIAADFEGKLRAAQSLGIHNLETGDRFDGVRLDDMTGAELERIRSLLIDYNMRIVLLTTAIPAGDREARKRLFRRALQLDVEAICLDLGAGGDADFTQRLADSYSMALCVENRADGAYPDEVRLLEVVREHGAKVIEQSPAVLAREEVLAMKKTKSGEKQVDIRPMVVALEPVEDGFRARLMLTEQSTLKPDLLVRVLAEQAGVEPPEAAIHRTLLLGLNENGEPAPLMAL